MSSVSANRRTPPAMMDRPLGERVALVHDYLLVPRGAERTFAAIADCWPEAPVYTLLYDPETTRTLLPNRRIVASPLQPLGIRQAGFRRLLPLYPLAVERLPVGDYDVVVSSSSAFAHGVRPGSDAVHVCYCHSPFRYVWHERDRAMQETPRILRPIARRGVDALRRWDVRAAARVDCFIANSQLTRRRINDYWGRDAVVIHPPVDVERFAPGTPDDYLLVVGEVLPHKRVDVALEAARRARMPIKVVGGGPALADFARRYPRAEFLGRVCDQRLAELYAGALALVVPNVEEFGIAAVEAQAAGRPVIGVDAGGTQETVIPGLTGVLVPPDGADSLAEVMMTADFAAFDPNQIRTHALEFSAARFKERICAEIRRVTPGYDGS
jgi:glycosyltransferase involved in cell wall biosynthesis